ncbi:helicase-related protein, partial [Burkholderia gladioli]|uniref:helicase-related protein n=1 Tax=Burkholderia gladioli TaxID=28095 RepID=UPI002445E138
MQKALFSSPAAALKSTSRRIAALQSKSGPTPEELCEVEGLEVLADALKVLFNDSTAHSFSKYQRLLQQLRSDEFGWQPQNADDRLVIFSERIDTLEWLQKQLTLDLKLKSNQLAVLHGGMPDTDQQSLVERFGRKEDSLRVLLCSDVAS